ncbi:esterase [Fulvivirga sedimenti]|uniref:Esterase n=1 Tax=Fulvivirga sedimenti TaxID=2879465 RepID=A0A9X1HVW9_9BACT|nr:esterase [Fulvivirga sedimenti]MCA6078355.1 esterase [Fulvivirga sedimenti]
MKRSLKLSPGRSMVTFLFILLASIHSPAQFTSNLISPEISSDNTVTFRIHAPNSDDVQLTGSWMAFNETAKLIKGDTGTWTLTVGPLAPELYGYNFIVDGVNTLDPLNKHIKRDGTWRVENVLFIRGTASDLYEPKTGPKGTVSQVWYSSPTLGMTRRMIVYTPPGYAEGNEKYPVMYLLHGGGGDEEAWPDLGVAPTIMDNLINQKKAVPMIVVMTNGNPDQAAAYTETPVLDNPSRGAAGMANKMFEESLVKDVIPYIEKNYRVKTGKQNRALTGLSMGGLQTMNTTFKYPDMFNYIGVMSMGFADLSAFGIEVDLSERDQQIDALKKADPKLYWIACGKDDFLYESVTTMRKELDEHGFDYTYRESTGGHTWSNWRIYLSEFAPMLFK